MKYPRYNIHCRSIWIYLLLTMAMMPTYTVAEELWKSGKNQRVELVKQERSLKSATRPNQHPVSLDGQELLDALSVLRTWSEGGYFSERKLIPLFSPNQQRILARSISQGLADATADQDLIFSLAGGVNKDTGLSFFGHRYTAGRIFYADDKLNIIIGTYRRAKDKGAEAMAGQFGQYEIEYNFNYGRRSKVAPSYSFDEGLSNVDGLESMRDEQGTVREDWLLLDVTKLVAVAQFEKQEQFRQTRTGQNFSELEQARRERAQLRAQLARMNKRMQELSAAEGTAENDSSAGVRTRIQTLEKLYADGLIDEQEYQRKRKEILNDI